MECRKEESMTEKYFPQVGDNELMLTEMPHMNLYDETDLISNITGDYVDKNYLKVKKEKMGHLLKQDL